MTGSGSELWARWRRTERRRPSAIAAIRAQDGVSWSRVELTREAEAFAEILPATSARSVLAFSEPNGLGWLRLFWAIQARGATAAPIDAALQPGAAKSLALQIGADALWDGASWHPLVSKKRRRTTAACWKFTSGSTTGPIVIPCPADALLADADHIVRTMGLRESDRNLATIPLGHSYGLGNLVLPLILQGTPLVVGSSPLPRQILDAVIDHGVTVLPSVPPIFRALAALPGKDKAGRLRLAISAGAVLTSEVAEAFERRFGVPIHNFYGSSETGGVCYDRTGERSRTGAAVGTPLRGVRVTLAKDARVCVTSAAVAVGKRVGRMRRCVLPDFGEWTEDGALRLIGRASSVANIGGRKVHPAEVEHAIRGLNGVREAWVKVCAGSGRDLGRDFLAVAVESERDAGELERDLVARLADWKCPRRWVVRISLPRNSRGKLDRVALEELLA